MNPVATVIARIANADEHVVSLVVADDIRRPKQILAILVPIAFYRKLLCLPRLLRKCLRCDVT